MRISSGNRRSSNGIRVLMDSIVCAGGLDLITPTLSLRTGVASDAVNFECSPTGGYARIDGYERYDGRTSPSDPSIPTVIFSVTAILSVPTVSHTISGPSGTGVLAYLSGTNLTLVQTTGTFAIGDTVTDAGVSVGVISAINVLPLSGEDVARTRAAVADIYRADIGAVPGSGPVCGVVIYNDAVYAWRNNTGGTAKNIYKSTSSGWTQVTLFNQVSFTSGTGVPTEGATLTQGAVTATLKRAALRSGAWTGTAAGIFVIGTPAGGNFVAGAATIGTTTITLSGAQTAIVIPAGGRIEAVNGNLSGQANTIRIYGADGVGTAFEFDGVVYVPIPTGASVDTPKHVAINKARLWVSLGSSIMCCAPGLPYDWTAINGAAEIATGDTVTAIGPLPGSSTIQAMSVYGRSTTSILYGSSASDWNLITFNSGSGAVDYTAEDMGQTLAFDDRGVVSLDTSLQFGNFTQTTLTHNIAPFIDDRVGKVSCSTLCRTKSQYRVFFNDGYGIFVTVVNGKRMGSMPVFFPNDVVCATEGKNLAGTDISFFGSSNGYVYQLERGSSFDGAAIDSSLCLNYSSAGSPRFLKRYRKASVEIVGTSFLEFNFGYYLGYGSGEYAQAVDVAKGMFLSKTSRWDQVTWDSFFWDSTGLSTTECEICGTAENISLLFYGHSAVTMPFTINSILVHYSFRRGMR